MIEQKKSNADKWASNLGDFMHIFREDLPDPVQIGAELDIWVRRWSKVEDTSLPDRVSCTLLKTDPDIFRQFTKCCRSLVLFQ